MDSNKKTRCDRTRTPVPLSVSEYNFKSSATKRFSPNVSRRPNLNETVSCRTGSTTDFKIKTKHSTAYAINYETECDIDYNNYLQALLKKQLAKKKVAEHKQTLEVQLLMQNENLYKRNQNYQEIVKNTETIQKQSEVVEIIDFLQKNLTNLQNAYAKYDIKLQLNNFEQTLNMECDKGILRNVKNFENQEEYDKFMSTLQVSLIAMEKIINSGREFEKVHTLAEDVRNFINLRNTVQKSQQIVSKLETDGLYSFLQNTSDLFAKKYNDPLD